MSMPPTTTLVELPEDILDQCMGELLPPIDLSSGIFASITPTPTDLYNVMLVSKRLHSLALPWAWRRINVYLRPTVKLDGEYVDSLVYYEKSLFCHPERFAHVRLLTLSFNCFEKNFDVAVLLSLKSCITFMENLQWFSCETTGRHTNEPLLQEIFIELASKPRVHTISTSLLPATRMSSLNHPRRLIVSRLEVDESTLWTSLEIMPFLESLTLAYVPYCFLPFPVPWNTLRGLQFFECSHLDCIMHDFSQWKLDSSNNHSPLEEITAEFFFARVHAEVVPACLDSILDTFKAQELKTFTLVDYPGIDGVLIHRIAEAFPSLQELTLVSQPWSSYEWEGLSPIVIALGAFPLLRYLRWSYRNVEYDTDTPVTEDSLVDPTEDPTENPSESPSENPSENPSEEHVKRLKFEEIIPHVAQHCDALEIVKFFDWRYRSGTFSITRDESGKYMGYDEVEDEETELKTYSCFSSSLSPTAYRHM